MVVKAVYRDGVFRPVGSVGLAEGELVELEIVRLGSQNSRDIVSLRGLWREHVRPEEEGDWISEAVAEIRRQSSGRLERLAQELGEDLTGD
jgi:predicted DNA-binding antitoxin AbrB/MazE fold protein